MATVITPFAGAGVGFTEQGIGAVPGYGALDLRRGDSLPLQEGVYGPSDFMVTQRGAGADRSVDISVGAGPVGGFACVQGDTITGQGMYTVPAHDATINEPLAPADATNPRVDRVGLQVLDNDLDGSGSSLARTIVLTGDPSSGATLTNLTGAQVVPEAFLLLADVLVGNGVTSVDNTKIRDRRKWARGAFYRYERSSADYTFATIGSYTAVDATNMAPRIECSGVPVRVVLSATMTNLFTAANEARFDLFVDGTQQNQERAHDFTATDDKFVSLVWSVVPAAGSHVIDVRIKPSADQIKIGGTGTSHAVFMVEEHVRQNAANNTTTSG